MLQLKDLAGIPTEVKRFVLFATILFVSWKAIYLVWLQPSQLLDRPLVEAIASQTTKGLNLLTSGAPYSFRMMDHTVGKTERFRNGSYTSSFARIYKGVDRSLVIVPSCDALELMVLYAGFIVCFPSSWKRKWFPIVGGIIAIHLVNVARCIALVLLYHSSWSRFFDFTHHYLFTMTIYLFIFMLWVWYVKFIGGKANSADVYSSQ